MIPFNTPTITLDRAVEKDSFFLQNSQKIEWLQFAFTRGEEVVLQGFVRDNTPDHALRSKVSKKRM